MFITKDKSLPAYDRDGQQRARGSFLIFLSTDSGTTIRCAVRRVTLRQLGHWMMGEATIGGIRFPLSGAYGADGLTLDARQLPADIFAQLVELPSDLRNAWNKGGGWNSSGAEGPAIREWALKNINTLRRACR